MAQVETLSGPIDTADLGFTLMHEHVFVLSEGVRQSFPQAFDEDGQVAAAVDKLRELESRGVRTIVDLTVFGTGRDVPLMQCAVGQTSLQVIIATGLYTYDQVPHYFESRDADFLAGYFVADITDGIQGTGVKAAVLKCATDRPGVTPGVEKVLRAVARAHRRTGVPISTHTHARSQQGLRQQEVFESEGVDLGRVIIGHSGDSDDIEYLTALLKKGSYLGMDRFGLDQYLPTEKRVATVVRLCELGHAASLVLSHDTACYLDWFPAELIRANAPKWTFTHISDDILPALKRAGVMDEQVRAMTVDNPRRIFERQGAY